MADSSEKVEASEGTQATEVPVFTPPENAVDISPKQDGGVLKVIKRPGEGDDTPMPGDQVFVHYVGTLTDGTKFDSSRDRDELFEFSLGKGSVIKSWDIGVATMRKGELAVLYCKPEYAYGESGSPPKIPPQATLIFEVELFHWKGEDLSVDKDGGILRTILDKGEGLSTPNAGATCEAHIIGKYNNAVFEDKDVNFTMGDGSDAGLVDGIEQALKKFKKGEKSRLTIAAKYGYGGEGSKEHNIPPNADLEYVATLTNFEKAKESWEMDTAEKIEQAELMKQKGTDYFKQGKYQQAMRYYQKIADLLDSESSVEGGDKEKRDALMLAGHLNMAMCYLKANDSLSARDQCDKALDMDPKNLKGLFRRGTARMNLQDYTEALADLSTAISLDPSNKAARNLMATVKQKIKADKDRQKKLYSGMFDKFAEIDSKKEQLNPDTKPANMEGEEGSEEEEADSEGESDGEAPQEKETNDPAQPAAQEDVKA